MTIIYHADLEQGSDEWKAIRTGILTASEMKLIITPAQLKVADNEESRQHLYELAAQRSTKYVEPKYISDDMLRGTGDEFYAKSIYNDKIAPLQNCGFITNDEWGFTLGYSPDALVGDDGLIECKSRRQKLQFQTIIAGEMPKDFLIQVQTGLLVSKRSWIDFVSYCGGMPMFPKRIYPDEGVQAAIVSAAISFHEKLEKVLAEYATKLADPHMRLIPTERVVEQEISL